MKIYFILLCCSLSFLGTAQGLETNENSDQFESNSFYYQTVKDSIGKLEKNDTKYNKVRYGVSINQSFTRYGLPTGVLFTLNYKKHQFDLGPQFRLGRSITADQKNIGIEFNYRYYILGDTTWFSSYALFNADYFYEYSKPDRFGVYYSTNPTLNGQVSTSSTTNKSFALNLGYGIKFNLVEGFYLGSHVGIGACFTFEDHNISLVNVDWNNSNKTRETNLGFIGSVFIGYKF